MTLICVWLVTVYLDILKRTIRHVSAVNDLLQRAQCKVLSSNMDSYKRCVCGNSCKSWYPCLQIQVSYSYKGKRLTGSLYRSVRDDDNKVRKTKLWLFLGGQWSQRTPLKSRGRMWMMIKSKTGTSRHVISGI